MILCSLQLDKLIFDKSYTSYSLLKGVRLKFVSQFARGKRCRIQYLESFQRIETVNNLMNYKVNGRNIITKFDIN